VPHAFAEPPRWDSQQLREARDEAEHRFTEQRRDEGPRAFARTCNEVRPRVEAALDAADDLLGLDERVFLEDPAAWQAFRYVCGPPISQEDLWTLVGGPKFRTVPPNLAGDTARALQDVIDPVRFPWVAERRRPTDTERDAAVLATTILWSAQVLGTTRRGEASVRQETAAAAALDTAGIRLDPDREPIWVLDGLDRGTYSRERKVAGAKCDVPARLHDGRLLALECKVSNGPKNSWKRVNREVGGKAEGWRQHFGAQVLTGVVLAGVFDLSCLRAAQDAGVIIFWEHDLTALAGFVRDAR
jgi:hypothetical protein